MDKKERWLDRVGMLKAEKDFNAPEHFYRGRDVSYSPIRCHILSECAFDFPKSEDILHIIGDVKPLMTIGASELRAVLRGEMRDDRIVKHGEKVYFEGIGKPFKASLLYDSLTYANGEISLKYHPPRVNEGIVILVASHPFGLFLIASLIR
ncbi:MAG: hypothetical protein QXU75_09550 [Candidatus Methanomethylicaceae archaeon]